MATHKGTTLVVALETAEPMKRKVFEALISDILKEAQGDLLSVSEDGLRIVNVSFGDTVKVKNPTPFPEQQLDEVPEAVEAPSLLYKEATWVADTGDKYGMTDGELLAAAENLAKPVTTDSFVN